MPFSKQDLELGPLIIAAVCRANGVAAETLFLSRRGTVITCDARRQAYALLRGRTGMTCHQIGGLFGVSHGAVSHALETHRSLMISDRAYCQRYLDAGQAASLEISNLKSQI